MTKRVRKVVSKPTGTGEYEYSYGKQNWHDNMRAECEAVRNAVGLFDQSSFAKFDVSGDDATDARNRWSGEIGEVQPAETGRP